MDIIQQAEWLRGQLEQRRRQWTTVAAESGVPYKTINNFMQRPGSFPRAQTLSKLVKYFEGKAREAAEALPAAAATHASEARAVG